MADVTQTIAGQLNDLIQAKENITAAINESAVGTTHTGSLSNTLFTDYGDIIRAIFAVQDITTNCSNLGELFVLGKLACYYVDGSKLTINGFSLIDSPTEKNDNMWLFSMAVQRENVLDNIAQLVIVRTIGNDDLLSKLFLRFSASIENGTVTSWSSWFEYAPKSVAVEDAVSAVLGGEGTGSKGDIVFANSGETSPAVETGTAGQIYVDIKTQSIYIHDGQKWQLMNSWQ